VPGLPRDLHHRHTKLARLCESVPIRPTTPMALNAASRSLPTLSKMAACSRIPMNRSHATAGSSLTAGAPRSADERSKIP
jgi:hypothetical protein